MQSKQILLLLVLISIANVVITAGCTPDGAQTGTPGPSSSGQTKSDSLQTVVTATPLETSPAMSTIDASDPISVTLDSSKLSITNNTANNIYFAAFPQETLAFIEWAPCESPQQCQNDLVAPNTIVSIPLKAIVDRETTTITIFWWHLEKIANEERHAVVNLHSSDLKIKNE